MPAAIIDEVSGVFEATLREDMMDTVVNVKRPYIDCYIPKVFDDSQEDRPLVYVPAWFATYPLKKGDKVLVKFNQDNLRYPYLWKIPTEYGTDFTKDIQFPTPGSYVIFPSPEKVVAVKQVNADTFVYITDKYTLLRTNDEFTLFSPDGTISNLTSLSILAQDVTLELKKSLVIAVQNDISLKSTTTALVEIGNSIDTLGGLLDDLMTKLDSLCTKLGSLHTEGPPTNHTAVAWYGTDIAPLQVEINTLKAKMGTVFKK